MSPVRMLKLTVTQLLRTLSAISYKGEDLKRRRYNRLAPRMSEKFGCWPHRGIW
ncbi:hypothetical protein [Pseudochrobactrum sp. HB0163]|uniref:hypothetical protein n=1 Tax=Pseudochrobactrum sp. HB0163 TaxID=3450708 RepID=UPI003F6DFB37